MSTVNTIILTDETGVNPLPAGIPYSIYPADLPYGTTLPVLSGFTKPGSQITSAGLTSGTPYFIVFSIFYTTSAGQAVSNSSFQSPGGPLSFTPTSDPWTIMAPNYESNSRSAEGYTDIEMRKLPKRWFSDAAKSPGGIAHAIGLGYGTALAELDLQAQYNLQQLRFQSCVGSQQDSWSKDMVSTRFGRYVNETDVNFYARNLLMISRPRTTIPTIQAMVQAFYNSTIAGYRTLGEALAFGVPGAGSFGISGGFGKTPPPPGTHYTVPPILVWDSMTAPGLASSFGVAPPQFVIQIGYILASLKQQLAYGVAGAGGYSVGQGGFSTVNEDVTPPALSNEAPDPRLGLLVDWITKAAGTQPLYLVGQFPTS